MIHAILATALFVVPLVQHNNLLFVNVKVNGVETLALIDTGSFNRVQLSSTLVTKLNLPATESDTTQHRYDGAHRLSTATLPELRIGDYAEKQVGVSVAQDDIERIASQVGVPFDAILGWGFWSGFNVELAPGELRFSRDALPAAAPVAAFPFRESNRVPVIDATLGDQGAVMLFDTGAPRSTFDAAEPGARVRRSLVAGSLRTDIDLYAKNLSAMRRGVGASAVLGNDVLRQWIVRILPSAHRIELRRSTA
jgi:Aspartyl protease